MVFVVLCACVVPLPAKNCCLLRPNRSKWLPRLPEFGRQLPARCPRPPLCRHHWWIRLRWPVPGGQGLAQVVERHYDLLLTLLVTQVSSARCGAGD